MQQEKDNFSAFSSDCSMVQELSAQVKLLEKYLKIGHYPRHPSNVKASISRMQKSAARQLDFARKNFQINEKLFLSKWKHFFDFDSENKLCPILIILLFFSARIWSVEPPKCNVKSADDKVNLGYKAQAGNRTLEAVELYTEAINTDPKCSDARYEIGWSFWKLGEWQKSCR